MHCTLVMQYSEETFRKSPQSRLAPLQIKAWAHGAYICGVTAYPDLSHRFVVSRMMLEAILEHLKCLSECFIIASVISWF